MAKLHKLEIDVDTKDVIKKMEAVRITAERLKLQLDQLKNVEIGISVIEKKNKWYQFWK